MQLTVILSSLYRQLSFKCKQSSTQQFLDPHYKHFIAMDPPNFVYVAIESGNKERGISINLARLTALYPRQNVLIYTSDKLRHHQ